MYKTKKIQQLHSFRHYNNKKRILCNMYTDPNSLVQKEKPQSHFN